MSLLRIKKANFYPKTHRSGKTTWQVCVGTKANGKKDVRPFPSEAEAKNFANDWNVSLVGKNTSQLGDLSGINRHEVLGAIEKLKAFNATIPEAVDFFIKYARPDKGELTVEEAMDFFLQQKARKQCAPKYLKNCEKTFLKPFTKAFPERFVSEISPSEADKYIESHRTTWNGTTTRSHISYLRTFYEFLKKKGHAKLNPFTDIEKPCKSAPAPKTLTVEETTTLLQFALDKDLKPECAAMALVFFCGIRVEEVGRLKWQNVDFKTREVTLEGNVPKKEKRRVNAMSQNAVEWLRLCEMPSGAIAPNDYEQRMKRLPAERSGILITFSADGPAASIQQGDGNFTRGALGNAIIPLPLNTDFDIRITDINDTISLYFGNAATPILTATTSYRPGDKIAIYSREIVGNGASLDFVQVDSVPDVGQTGVFLGMAFLSLLGLKKKLGHVA